MAPIRVLVVDDSAFMRKIVSDIIVRDSQINVVGTARNGKVALDKLAKLSPNVVLLDVEMPEMDGITTLKRIMNETPIPIIMMSSVTKNITDKTVQAIASGAVDFIAKPRNVLLNNKENLTAEWIQKIHTAANASVPLSPSMIERQADVDFTKNYQPHNKTILAIGTSTGGPRALEKVLAGLPLHFPVPILIVQHMPAKFTKSLAERLDRVIGLHVKEAHHGEVIKPQTVYIAPGGFHMKLEQTGSSFTIELSKEEPILGHRPSVDILFRSLAQQRNIKKIAVILTGMGKDGTKGILQLKQSDPDTVVIAETEASAIVYGMPKSAIQTNQVDHISHLHQISEMVTQIFQ